MTVTTQANMEGRPSVADHGAHITTMVRSHASGDEDAFYTVALQVAAREARQGHHRLAPDIKAVGPSRQRAHTPLATVAAHRWASLDGSAESRDGAATPGVPLPPRSRAMLRSSSPFLHMT